MNKKLAIVLGAGASYSQNPDYKPADNQDFRPPLTKDIFSTQSSYAAILHKYPLAEILASDISRNLRQNSETIGLEQILKKYEDRLSSGEDSHITRQFLQVPLYLNDLLGEVSQHFTHQPDEYDTLINNALDKADEVLFLTLNYDNILEIPLSRIFGLSFSKISDYITNPKWNLVKLHGSVNWYHGFTSYTANMNEHEYFKSIRESRLPLPLDESFVMTNIPGHQKKFIEGIPVYPAITVPVDGKYDLNCPPEMIEKAEDFLKECPNYLIIGSSGNDKDLLDLLKGFAKGGHTALVGTDTGIEEAKGKFLQGVPQLGVGFNTYGHERGFTTFVERLQLDSFLNQLV